MATFYSLLPFLFKIKDHKFILVFFNDDPSAGFIFAFFAVALWVIYFIQRYKARQM
jgi:hypothetical protein